jgi:hypothetical protein
VVELFGGGGRECKWAGGLCRNPISLSFLPVKILFLSEAILCGGKCETMNFDEVAESSVCGRRFTIVAVDNDAKIIIHTVCYIVGDECLDVFLEE